MFHPEPSGSTRNTTWNTVFHPTFARRAPGGIAGFGGDIGNAERFGDVRAEKVRRPIVVVIGEPDIWAWSPRAILREQVLAPPGGVALLAREGSGARLAKIGALGRDRLDGMAERSQRGCELARHAAIARDAVVTERVQRSMKGDAQAGFAKTAAVRVQR